MRLRASMLAIVCFHACPSDALVPRLQRVPQEQDNAHPLHCKPVKATALRLKSEIVSE